MQVAVWNIPPADLMVSGFHSGAFQDRVTILRSEIYDCERLLREGTADVALLPTISILKEPDDFDVLPAVALSSWGFPFARLTIDHGLDEPIRRVSFDPRFGQERIVTDIVLREHYKMEAEFVPHIDGSHDILLQADTDARLLIGADVPMLSEDGGLILDIGQEWYELAQYPMVWGLFATLKERATPGLIRTIRDGVRASEKQRLVWIRAQETSADLHEFYRDDLRLRMDDLVAASLTELKQFLFYYEMIDEVRDIPFAFLADDEDEEGRKPLL